MDPVTVGAVLLAILSGAGEGLGGKLWDGMIALVRRPFRKDVPTGDTAEVAIAVPGIAELAALQQAPADQQRAVALAEVLLARSAADPGFRRALETWWDQAEPVRATTGGVSNVISGGTQQGPVLQGRDFSNLTFGASPLPPSTPPNDLDAG